MSRDERMKYWNGENERERMIDEVLASRKRGLLMAFTLFLQALVIVGMVVALIWGMAALVK